MDLREETRSPKMGADFDNRLVIDMYFDLRISLFDLRCMTFVKINLVTISPVYCIFIYFNFFFLTCLY